MHVLIMREVSFIEVYSVKVLFEQDHEVVLFDVRG